ncbi:MAG TPA: YeeE/YedE family protein [bacterium]|nr:YeeE/YedE family protein [bacterium]
MNGLRWIVVDAVTVLLGSVLLIAIVFGAAAQFSRVCLPGGLREWVLDGKRSRISAYLIAIGAAVFFTALLQAFAGLDLNDTKPPYRSPQFAWGRYMLGGFIFGVGMVMTRGCPARNLVKLGQGNLQSLPVLIVVALTAYVMTRTPVYAEWFAPWVGVLTLDLTRFGMAHQDLASLFGGDLGMSVVLGVLIAVAFWWVAAQWLQFRQGVWVWLGASLVGLMVALGYTLTGGRLGQAAQEAAELMDTPPEGLGVQSFTFSAPLGDVVHFLGHPSATTITFGVVAVVGVLLGAWLSAMARREFKLIPFGNLREWLITMSGAVLAGVGSVLAMGCTVGQGFSGVASLALGSFVALAAIVAGGVVAHRLSVTFGRA